MRGRVEAGTSSGGVTYGYKVVRGFDAHGSPVTGERAIDGSEAAVVVRIFKQYGAGVSPHKIALALNGDGMTAPQGGAWTASTINGNRARGTGILNNEVYVGRLVWNRLTYMKDSETSRRRSLTRAAVSWPKRTCPNCESCLRTFGLWQRRGRPALTLLQQARPRTA